MRFVEETGGSWTAEQLRAAEAEIEQQKREWEANRLAALKKEEDAVKRADADENELLTYSREDAKNQVNIRSKPVNPRLLTIKGMNNRRRAKKRKAITTETTLNPSTSRRLSVGQQRQATKRQKLTTNNINRLKKRKGQNVSAKSNRVQERKIPKRACRLNTINSSMKKLTTNSVKSVNDLHTDSSSNNDTDDNDDSQTSTAYDTHSQVTGPEEFDDSECSLDVMFDSTDAQDSDDSNSSQTSSSQNNDDDDEKEDHNDCVNGKENHINEITNRRESIHNHVDINSPRTRSRGTVKLNLWTLDVSPILPGIKSKTRKPKSSLSNLSNETSSSIGNHNKSSDETGIPTTNDCENNVTEDDDDSQTNNTLDEQSFCLIKQAKILDGFTTTSLPRPLSKKILPRKLLTSNGKKNHTLDSWISKSPRTRRALSPKVLLSKDEIQKHFNQVAAADMIRKTRRTSVLRTNSEYGPS